MSTSSGNTILSKIRVILWPIEREELKLFMPMALLMLCILFNFSALRSIKDGLVVPSIGAEAISFLKLWLILPIAIIFTLTYVKLSNIMQMEQIFYLLVSFFLLVFISFAYILYPAQEYYHPSAELISRLATKYPHFQWFLKLYGKWSYALVYIFGELWSVVVINLMFWQFANHIIASNKARRFYPTLGLVGNFGLILAGNTIICFTDLTSVPHKLWHDIFGGEYLPSEITLKLVVGVVAISGIVAMMLLRYIHTNVLAGSNSAVLAHHDVHDTQTKLSVRDSISLVMKSRYIGYIVIMIVCYGLIINILEGPWKAKIKELYPTTQEYIGFMGEFNIWMGISSVTFMLLGSNVLRNFSWFLSAMITPVMIGVTGTLFFAFVVFEQEFAAIFGDAAFNPIYAAVMVGALQNILGKSTKYSLFDSTKEMAYIPLSRELRTKGKAAAEILGAKIGKSLGALVQSGIFIFMPMATFDTIASTLMVVFIIVVIIWLMDVRNLNEEYSKITTEVY